MFFVFLFSSNSFATDCTEIPISENNTFYAEAQVEGARGTLRFPVVIDTGASMTLIPYSIARGIGYSKTNASAFATAGGAEVFDMVKISKLTIAGIEFHNVEVAVKPDPVNPSWANPLFSQYYNNHQTMEYGLLGMEQLKQTSMSYANGILTICKAGSRSVEKNNKVTLEETTNKVAVKNQVTKKSEVQVQSKLNNPLAIDIGTHESIKDYVRKLRKNIEHKK